MAIYIFRDKGGVKKPACLAFLERIEGYAEGLVKIHSQEIISAADARSLLNTLAAAFIEGLKSSEIPKEFRNEIMGRIGKIITSIPSGVALNTLRENIKSLRAHLQRQHTCQKCGKVNEFNDASESEPNYICGHCGYKTRLLLRRELMDLSDPVEGELALRIAGISLRKDK